MRYKSKVLARFPDARLVVCAEWPDGSGPRYHRVISGETYGPDAVFLDVHNPDSSWTQGPTAAWRSAYAWCKRNPAPKAAEISPREEFLWKNPGAVW